MALPKKTETKTVAPAKEVKAAPASAVKAEPVAKKEEAPKAAAPKKEAAPAAKKEAAPKKPAAPKKAAAKKEAEANVYVQFAGKEILAKDILDAAKKAYVAAGNKETDIKTIDIYVKPENSEAYYVVNGEGSDDFKIEI